MMDHIMARPSRPEAKIPDINGSDINGPGNGARDFDGRDFDGDGDAPVSQTRICAAEGCHAEAHYRAPKSRDALRDYIWFCLDHVRAYNRSWNYYEGLQGAALEAEIRRATTWERPSWKFATGKPVEEMFDDPLGLFDTDRERRAQHRTMNAQERAAWKTLRMEPVNDLDQVKQQYKALAKANHPDTNGGDAAAEERLKEINLAYDLVCKSLQSADAPPIS